MKKTYSQFREMSKVVSRTMRFEYDTPDAQVNRWLTRYRKRMQKGHFDIAHEYLCRAELLMVRTAPKNEPYRLTMWRLFVGDFRRAFSDYEFDKMQETYK